MFALALNSDHNYGHEPYKDSQPKEVGTEWDVAPPTRSARISRYTLHEMAEWYL